MIIDVVLSLIAEVCFEYMKSSTSDCFFFVFFSLITFELFLSLSLFLFLSFFSLPYRRKKYIYSHDDHYRTGCVTPIE